MIARRDLLVLLGAAALAPRAAFSQPKREPILIGWLHSASRDSAASNLEPFKESLAALGWKEGTNVLFEERWAGGHDDRLKALAEELAAKRPAVVVASTLRSVVAVAKAAPQTPIVIGTGDDPVAAGVVKSLAHPGGMITGTTNFMSDLSEKLLELLLATAPKVQRVGFLADPNNLNRAKIREAARRSAAQYAVAARFAEAATPEEVDAAVAALAKQGAQALVLLPSPWFGSETRRIAGFALSQRWPTIGVVRSYADDGLMLAYSIEYQWPYRRAAYYVDRILRGDKPGDLPIEQPSKFELTVNMKTANALGLKIPQSVLLRADRVIE